MFGKGFWGSVKLAGELIMTHESVLAIRFLISLVEF